MRYASNTPFTTFSILRPFAESAYSGVRLFHPCLDCRMDDEIGTSALEFLSEASLQQLGFQEQILYAERWRNFLDYLRTRGKNPARNLGYSDSNVRPLARRVHQVHQYCWEHDIAGLHLRPHHADEFVEGLNTDRITNTNDEPYAEGSKRKFTQALGSYFDFVGVDWEPDINFTEDVPKNSSDPFRLDERGKLLNASLNYNSPPNYKNVTPEERARWNAHLAQYLGKPKLEVGPDDWQELQRDWKIPSIVSTALDAGWRAEMVGRLQVDWVSADGGRVRIPPGEAVKNNQEWENELSGQSRQILTRWLEQRENNPQYDDSDNLWLNRQGNPYNSSSLNNLLRNLMEEAGIEATGRKLTWHSIRHSTGMYIYNSQKSLKMVAEVLRHASLEAAARYAHPSPETKRDAIESIQRGDFL